jgi:hypothetical protein
LGEGLAGMLALHVDSCLFHCSFLLEPAAMLAFFVYLCGSMMM